MKLKLIQAGGFVGRTKTAEEELDDLETDLQQHLAVLFNQMPLAMSKSQVRDKETLLLEFEGKVLPVHQLSLNAPLEKLIEQMKEKLQYQK